MYNGRRHKNVGCTEGARASNRSSAFLYVNVNTTGDGDTRHVYLVGQLDRREIKFDRIDRQVLFGSVQRNREVVGEVFA